MTLSPAQLDELGELLATYNKAQRNNEKPGRGPYDFMVAGLKLARRAGRDLPDLIATVRRLQSELAAKQAVIDKVGELHNPVAYETENNPICYECSGFDAVAYPCATIAALAGQEQT